VQAVQAALNKRAHAGLVVDGKCGPKTIAAIVAFQQSIGGFQPDGLVEPGKSTARALEGGGGEPAPCPPDPGPYPVPPNPYPVPPNPYPVPPNPGPYPVPPQPPPGRVDTILIVTDVATNNAIENALAKVGDQEEYTGNTGQATFSFPPGQYPYVVTAEGYGQASGTVEVTGNETELHVELKGGGNAVNRKVSFATMDEKTRKPVVDAKVQLGRKSATTNRKGEAEFALPPGSYPFRVTAEGYAEARGNLEVVRDEDVEWVELLQPAGRTGSVIFTVSDETNGKTIEGATVKVGKESLETGNIGLAVFVMPPGKYPYQVSAKGYKDAKGNLEIKREEDIHIVELLAPAGSAVTGSVIVTVSDETTGKTIEGATVEIGKSSLETGNAGFAVFFMPPGEYPYRVSAKGYEEARGTVEVTVDDDTRLVELLRRSDSSGGVVVSVSDKATDAPIDNAKVEIGKESGSTIPGSLGIVVFEGLRPGKHTYRVSAKGYQEAKGTVEVSDDDASPTPPLKVKLTRNKPAPPGTKKGKLTVEVIFADTKEAVKSAAVSVDPPAAPPAPSVGVTDSKGHAHFNGLTVGKCTVIARTAEASGNVTVNISADTVEVATIALTRAQAPSKAGAAKKCYPPQSLPDFHAAPDGEQLPTMRHLIPMPVLAKCKEVCVTGILTKEGAYKVVTEAWIDKSIIDELGLTPLDLAPIPKLVAIIVSMLTSAPTATEHHGEAKSASGKPVKYTVLYTVR
jgi:uncharacterized membrane protein